MKSIKNLSKGKLAVVAGLLAAAPTLLMLTLLPKASALVMIRGH